MYNDIEQRAEDYVKSFSKYSNLDQIGGLREGYLTAMTEERERGKRFNEWLVKKQYGYSYCSNEYIHHTHIGTWSYDKLFDLFLSKEKALNN